MLHNSFSQKIFPNIQSKQGLPFTLVAQTGPSVFHPLVESGDLKVSQVLKWTVEEYTSVFDCAVEVL